MDITKLKREFCRILTIIGGGRECENATFSYFKYVSCLKYIPNPQTDRVFSTHIVKVESEHLFPKLLRLAEEIKFQNKFHWLDIRACQINWNNVVATACYKLHKCFVSNSSLSTVEALKMARIYILLMLFVIDDSHFEINIFKLCLQVIYRYNKGGEAEEMKEQVQKFMIELNMFVELKELPTNTAEMLAKQLINIFRKTADTIYIEFGSQETFYVGYHIFTCLSKIIYRNKESLHMVLLKLFQAVLPLQISDDAKEVLNFQQSVMNYINYIINIIPSEWGKIISSLLKNIICNIRHNYTHDEAYEVTSQIINRLPERQYDGFLKWYRKNLIDTCEELRESMFYILKYIICKPVYKTRSSHEKFVLFALDTCTDALMDSYGNIQGNALDTISTLLVSDNEGIYSIMQDVLTYDDELMEKTMKLCGFLQKLLKQPDVVAKHDVKLIKIITHISLANIKWHSLILYHALPVLCNTFKSPGREYILMNISSLFIAFPNSTGIMSYCVHTVIKEFIESNDVIFEQAMVKDIYNMIFDKDPEIVIKDDGWKLVTMLVSYDVPLDLLFAKFSKLNIPRFKTKFKIPDSFVPFFNSLGSCWVLLSALTPYISEFEGADQMSEIFMEDFKSMVTAWKNPCRVYIPDSYKISVHYYRAVQNVLKFISQDKKNSIEYLMEDALLTSCIRVNEIPAVFSLCAELQDNDKHNWSKASSIFKAKEKHLFKKFSYVCTIYKSQVYSEFLRDIVTFSESAMMSEVLAEPSTIGLLMIFITPGQHGGMEDFFVQHIDAWSMFIRLCAKLTIRTKERVEECIALLKRLIQCPISDIQIQAIQMLYDFYKLNELTLDEFQHDAIGALDFVDIKVKCTIVPIIIELLNSSSDLKLAQINHLRFLSLVDDPNTSISIVVNSFIDDHYINKYYSSLSSDLMLLINIDQMQEYGITFDNIKWSTRLKLFFIMGHESSADIKYKLIDNVASYFLNIYNLSFPHFMHYKAVFRDSFCLILSCLPCQNIDDIKNIYKREFDVYWDSVGQYPSEILEKDPHLIKCDDYTREIIGKLIMLLSRLWPKIKDLHESLKTLLAPILTILVLNFKHILHEESKASPLVNALFFGMSEEINSYEFTCVNLASLPTYKVFDDINISSCKTRSSYIKCMQKKKLYEEHLVYCPLKFVEQ